MSVEDRLKQRTAEYSAQIEQARRAHVVPLNTLATEAISIYKERIKELEEEIERLSRRVAELEGLQRGSDVC